MEPPLAPSINSRSRSLIASVNRPGVGLALIAVNSAAEPPR
jgi:hypothetical protein